MVAPATPYDAKGLLKSAIRDGNPVVYFEHKRLYRSIKEDLPEGDFTVPIGVAEIRKEGRRPFDNHLRRHARAVARRGANRREGRRACGRGARLAHAAAARSRGDSRDRPQDRQGAGRARGSADGRNRRRGRRRSSWRTRSSISTVPCGASRLPTRTSRSVRRSRTSSCRAPTRSSTRSATWRRTEMAIDVTMPQMGESVVEGTIAKWLVKEGDVVIEDQPLCRNLDRQGGHGNSVAGRGTDREDRRGRRADAAGRRDARRDRAGRRRGPGETEGRCAEGRAEAGTTAGTGESCAAAAAGAVAAADTSDGSRPS